MSPRAKRKQGSLSDPFEGLRAEDVEGAEDMSDCEPTIEDARDKSLLIVALRHLLLSIRARAVAGYKPFRCYACDVPHVNGVCRAKCSHHEAIALLKGMGVEGLEGMQ